MKMFPRLLAVAIALSFFGVQQSQGVVGYVNLPFSPGDTLFQNPLRASPNNDVSSVFGSQAPVGTTISLWNPTANAFIQSSEYLGGGVWSDNLALPPGTGAKLTTVSLFTATLVGEVVTRDGQPFSEPIALPPPFSGPNGIYLLGDIFPTASTGTDTFLNVIGREPNVGEQITRLNTSTHAYVTSTYLGGGGWDILPGLRVGESAFFNIGPVPEPSAAALGLVAVAVFRLVSRRRS